MSTARFFSQLHWDKEIYSITFREHGMVLHLLLDKCRVFNISASPIALGENEIKLFETLSFSYIVVWQVKSITLNWRKKEKNNGQSRYFGLVYVYKTIFLVNINKNWFVIKKFFNSTK